MANLSELEKLYGLPSGVLGAIVNVESGGDNSAVSPKGAKGAFQFMPATAKAYGVSDPTDFDQSADGAARLMRDLLKQYDGNLDAALAHYNGGSKAGRAVAAGSLAPAVETQNYVPKVKGKMADNKMSLSDALGVLGISGASKNSGDVGSALEVLGLKKSDAPDRSVFGSRALRGLEDYKEGAQQLYARGMEAISPTPENIAYRKQIEAENAAREAAYQQGRGKNAGGFDGGRLLGNVAAPIAATVLAPETALTVAGAAGLSGLASLFMPDRTATDDTGNYLANKANNVVKDAVIGGGIQKGFNVAIPAAKELFKTVKSAATTDAAMRQSAQQVIIQNGIDLSAMSTGARASLIDDVAKALRVNPGELDKNALERLAAYRSIGAEPTRGSLTMNPATVTQEKNLAKVGVNSTDPRLNALGNRQNENAQLLLNRIDELGAGNANDSMVAGQNFIGDATVQWNAIKDNIRSLYKAAEQSAGRKLELDGQKFAGNVLLALEDAQRTSYLPPQLSSALDRLLSGKKQLTVDAAEELKTIAAEQIRTAQRAGDGTTAKALSIFRDQLERAPLLNASQVGEDTIAAFNKARAANRSAMALAERNPLLRAVKDGEAVPDKFLQQYFLGRTAKEAGEVIKSLTPASQAELKNQVVAYMKDIATGAAGSSNQQAVLNGRALLATMKTRLGTAKLNLLFSPEELATLKNIGTVARSEQFLPAGSAVNTSNSASAVGSAFARMIANSPIMSRLPVGNAVQAQVQSALNNVAASRATNIPMALGTPTLPALPNRFGNSAMLTQGLSGLLTME